MVDVRYARASTYFVHTHAARIILWSIFVKEKVPRRIRTHAIDLLGSHEVKPLVRRGDYRRDKISFRIRHSLLLFRSALGRVSEYNG